MNLLPRILLVAVLGRAKDHPGRPDCHLESRATELQAGFARKEEFAAVFARYNIAVQRFFSRRGFSVDESEDLAQEVFLRIYKSIDSYRHDGPFEGWLFQIAANVYRNRLRDRQALKRRGNENSLESFLEEVAQTAAGDHPLKTSNPVGPLEGFLDKERLAAVDRALETLPEQMRRCVVLRIHQELKYREIAAVMRISVDTVKAHLFQARGRLREELGAYFERIDFDIPNEKETA